MKWYKVDGVQFTGQPFIKLVKPGGKSICLVSDAGELFALSSVCPHAGANLAGGWCNDGEIICPFHRYSYSLKTGRGAKGQNDYVDTYPVKVENGVVFIGITSFWERIGLVKS
ncbi:Rieske (2Fe-2S) protein [Mucilaginibacter hurinus]|uniref:Rieske (2Fe-2S) protein n=1 Tax=Mucilaginibacter hurinus TaxID=2201324 RepID=A0A367GSX7_9SPHI|nr:Rieske 2Fe-2S domain-containing protein [Mucilaginibacter hurinus]RCH55881.1 Rieske (2Fe-2S) protein [Mucilaginibacter hurinus]